MVEKQQIKNDVQQKQKEIQKEIKKLEAEIYDLETNKDKIVGPPKIVAPVSSV